MESKSMEKTIIEGNRAIAEFMGGVCKPTSKQHPLNPYNKPTWWFNDKEGHFETPYHSSWEWLMPVVEKINTIAIDDYGEMGVWITPVQCLIGEDEHSPIVMTTKGNHPVLIDMVWTAVKTFVHWYNSQGVKPAK